MQCREKCQREKLNFHKLVVQTDNYGSQRKPAWNKLSLGEKKDSEMDWEFTYSPPKTAQILVIYFSTKLKLTNLCSTQLCHILSNGPYQFTNVSHGLEGPHSTLLTLKNIKDFVLSSLPP